MAAIATVGGAGLAGCSEEDRAAAADTAVRELVAQVGAEELKKAGVELKDALDCSTPKDGDVTTVKLRCTGTTVEDQKVTLTGTADADITGNVNGEFEAKVGDQVVFRKNSLSEGGEGGEGGGG